MFITLFSLLILVLLLVSVWYVPFRIGKLLDLNRTWPLYVGFGAMIALFIITMAGSQGSDSTAIAVSVTILGILFGFHVLLALLVVIVDIVRLFLRIPDVAAAWTVLGLAAGITLFGVLRAGDFSVNELSIPIEGLDRNVTVMHITDIHIGPQRGGDFLERIVEKTNEWQPDLVLITGDLVDGNSALSPGELTGLAGFDAPAYFTTGNHEYYIDTDRALEIITSHGIRILQNEMVETHGIQLIGLDYMNADEHTADMHSVNKFTIKEELPKSHWIRISPRF